MTDNAPDARRTAITDVLERYASDADFKARLLDDPRAALSAEGFLDRLAAPELESCGGPNTCSVTCGYPTCDETCGMITCALSV